MKKVLVLFLLPLLITFILPVPVFGQLEQGELCNPHPDECDLGLWCANIGHSQFQCVPRLTHTPESCISVFDQACPEHLPFNCLGSVYCCPDESFCYSEEFPAFETHYDVCQGNSKCIECQTGRNGTWTALGCIPVPFERSESETGFNMTPFITWLLKWAFGLGGGIALIIMIFGAFQIITSAGDPDKLKAGKEIIGAAVAGLLLIILAVFLLQFIIGAFELPIFR